MIGAMASEDTAHDAEEKKPKRSLGERIHDRLVAAEVAAEESAGYGWATEAVEAVETAVDPEHELGPDDKGETGAEERPPAQQAKPDEPDKSS